jgi:cell division control protein 6
MNGTLIRDLNAFEETWIPPILRGREELIRKVKDALRSVIENGESAELFFYGGSGTGKTALALQVKRELEEELLSAYINCWKTHTTTDVFKHVGYGLHIAMTGRNVAKEVVEAMKSRNEPVLIILDEADQADSINKVLAHFADVNKLLLIAISNNFEALDLDQRNKLRFNFECLEFSPYSTSQIVEILNDRVTHALRPKCINAEMIEMIAELSEGDARVAILTLAKAARKAEYAGLRKINERLIREAHEEAKKVKKSEKLNKLNFHARQIFLVVEENQGVKSKTKAYKLYSKRVERLRKRPVTERMFREYVSKMIKQCYLKEVEEKGKKLLYTCL